MKLSEVDLSCKLSKSEYNDALLANNLEIVKLQAKVIEAELPIVIAFEGWDAAGKGGSIARLTEYMDNRYCQVYGIAKPTADEFARHYMWRFWHRMPPKGHTAIFDRTWYGRVLVERVEGFATKNEWQRAYDEINRFEHDLIANKHCLLKFFLHIDPDEQKKRFDRRMENPLKRWKMSDEDYRNREKWPQYEVAIEDMLGKTHTDIAPWNVIPANCKKHARIAIQRAFIDQVSEFIKHL